MQNNKIQIHLAHTQGFCAGVSTAIKIVELALKKYGTPLYVYHEIVHNTSIIKDFENRGVVFVEDITDIPKGAVVIFSAHGVGPQRYEEAKKRGLHIIDATCPLVGKVHKQAKKFSKENIQTILIGHAKHQEIIGTAGYVNPHLLHIVEKESDIDQLKIDPKEKVGVLTQTTLSVADAENMITKIRAKYPNIVTGSKEDICYATQNRQEAVKELAKECDIIIVCGSPNSSNSNRLKETARSFDVPSYLVDIPDEFDLNLLKGKKRVGITSGASVPNYIVDGMVKRITNVYPDAKILQKPSTEKGAAFALPKELRS